MSGSQGSFIAATGSGGTHQLLKQGSFLGFVPCNFRLLAITENPSRRHRLPICCFRKWLLILPPTLGKHFVEFSFNNDADRFFRTSSFPQIGRASCRERV